MRVRFVDRGAGVGWVRGGADLLEEGTVCVWKVAASIIYLSISI